MVILCGAGLNSIVICDVVILQSDSRLPMINLTEKSYKVFGLRSEIIMFRSVAFLNLYLALDVSIL